jgi:hypothetical protein
MNRRKMNSLNVRLKRGIGMSLELNIGRRVSYHMIRQKVRYITLDRFGHR